MTPRNRRATALLMAALCCWSCSKGQEPKKVSLERRETPEVARKDNGERHLRIAVGGMITPREGLAYYKDFLDYLGTKLGTKVDYVDREDYAEINDLLRKRNLDAAFVCSGPYVDGHKEFGLELLAAPQAFGGTVYHSYIIVNKNSPIADFDGLRGKRFAFTDPLSNTGRLVPTYMLARAGETPDSFFREYIFTNGHDKSIKAVAQGIVDGAAVDSLIWEYLHRTNPEFTAQTRIVLKSPPYAIPPVVVPRDLDPLLKARLRQALLEAHNDPRGKEILARMMIDRFVVISDSAYDSIRSMKAWIAGGRAGASKP